MDLFKHIKEGEAIELRVGALTTRSKVERIDSELEFVITQPTHKLMPVIFHKDETVTFYYFRENGIFAFHAQYTGKGKIGKVSVCYFLVASEAEKSQRRISFRMPVSLPMQLRRKNQHDQSRMRTYTGITANLSLEGALFTCKAKFNANTRLILEIYLSDTELFIIEGDVIRCDLPVQPDEPYLVAIKFVNLTKNDKSQLSKFILKRQIADRKKRQAIEE
ncbi:MAG: flagellar brake protein [Clostridiales bacterium]|jgi:c-di-GMP-binding flagellar brake protein YcgR|nr:flagellar brake protein [Clostridiales bacterium]